MLEKLKEINYRKIELYANNEEKLELHNTIKDILDMPNIFLTIDMETAYSILRDLEIPEENLNEVYCELIEPKM